MRLAWLTDIHLNFVDAIRLDDLFASVRDRADAVAISGDIAESRDVCHYLRSIEEIVQKPIYFVLGNHDFYRGSIPQVRRMVTGLASESRNLKYLTAMQVVELTPSTAIIGHDGWADARFGDYRRSNVILSDHPLIAEIARWFDGSRLDKDNLLRTMTALADEAAGHFATVLEEAASKYPNVIAVTHVPPFREAAWYQEPDFQRRLPSPFRLQGRGRHHAGRHARASDLQAPGSLRSHARWRRNPGIGQHPGADRRGRVWEATNQRDYRSRVTK